MKEAASFSLKPGLKRCLQGAKETHPNLRSFPSFVGSFTHKQTLLDSLEQLNGLSSEAGEASVQHERYQGDHRIHVGPDAPQVYIVMKMLISDTWNRKTVEENKWP